MIEKRYVCDLCGQDVKATGTGWPASRRVKFMVASVGAENVRLCELADNEASDKVLCGKCLAGLKKALEKQS